MFKGYGGIKMTYQRLKKLIAAGRYIKEDMVNMLDVFLMSKRITAEQYAELTDMINAAEA